MFLSATEGEHLAAAMARAMGSKESEVLDFTVPNSGPWRAWIYSWPIPPQALALLVRKIPPEVSLLSPQERNVCRLLATGLGSKEIAARLKLARNTVDVHRRRIAERLHRPSRSLAAWCGEYREWL